MAPAKRVPWSGSFADLALCLRSDGQEVVLQGVHFTTTGLTDARVWLHLVTPAYLKTVPAHRRADSTLYGSLRGAPPTFANIRDRPVGQFLGKLSGVKVGSTCRQESRVEAQIGRGEIPDHPLQELWFSATTGASGGRFS